MTTHKELCDLLNGREYGEEISDEIKDKIKDTDFVIVYGYSDDGMEFNGAIHDDISCCGGCTAYLDKDGLIKNQCDESDCPYYEHIIEQAVTIKAIWHDRGEYAWTYETNIFHETFDIMEDGKKWCRGIAFLLSDVEKAHV